MAPHASLGQRSPFEVVFGNIPRLPGDPALAFASAARLVPAERIQLSAKALRQAQVRNKARQATAEVSTFLVGDEVGLRDQSQQASRKQKLSMACTGPHRIRSFANTKTVELLLQNGKTRQACTDLLCKWPVQQWE